MCFDPVLFFYFFYTCIECVGVVVGRMMQVKTRKKQGNFECFGIILRGSL